jgi:hypothetical protein
LEAVDFFRGAEQILDMVADFMGDHIGLGEVTGCSESMRHLVEEGKV